MRNGSRDKVIELKKRRITSELSGFYRLDIDERRTRIAEMTGLSAADLLVLSGVQGLTDIQADRMVENALGVMGLPLGLCVNLCVNGKDWLVPMATEEPSVVAAASHAAKLLRAGGGIHAETSPAHMIGQIQLLDVADESTARDAILNAREELLHLANHAHCTLIAVGGGAIDLEVHTLNPTGPDDPVGKMLIVHLVVDVREAMGANIINSMCERLAPKLSKLTGGRVGLRILSNLTDRRTARVSGSVPFEALEGKGCGSPEELARGIEEASVFAERDPYRAATHNKGIMNGVDAVLLAFGQDWRAVEAGAHAYAARQGRYTALAKWRVNRDNRSLDGELTLPIAVGVVGGVAQVHPIAKICRQVSQVSTAADLATITVAVGLAQNLSALRALAAEGIQQGHMRLHARNIAVEAGAIGEEVERIAGFIADQGCVSVAAAREALQRLR